jgi:hypothetical protein
VATKLVTVRLEAGLVERLRGRAGARGVSRTVGELVAGWLNGGVVSIAPDRLVKRVAIPALTSKEFSVRMVKAKGLVRAEDLPAQDVPPTGCPCQYQVRGGVCGVQAVRWAGQMARCGEH